MPSPTRRASAWLGGFELRASAWALALGLGFAGFANAQPAPVDSSSFPAPIDSSTPQPVSLAPIGSYILHGRLVDQPAYRGGARIEQSGAEVRLIRAQSGEAEVAFVGSAAASDRWLLVSDQPAGTPGVRRWGTVTASRLNLRSGPGGNNPAKGQAPQGARLAIVGEAGVWLEVLDRDGRRLWTHGGYVDVETHPTDGAALIEIVADPRGPWAVEFVGERAVRVERFEEQVNELIFLGMGDHASHEVWDLRSVQGVKVHSILDSHEDDVIDAFGARRDLNEDADVEGFLDDLGVQGNQRDLVKRALSTARRDAKDECANLVIAYWEAERGDRVLERMILSGHCVGSGVWGDSNGSLSFSILPLLNEAFPNAASQVEDLMIAGCYSSSLRQVDRFRGWFPKLRSFWAYGDSAPGSWTGATIHNALWEEASRGQEPGLVSRVLARGTRKGDNVATWNEVLGYEADGPLRPLATIRAEVDASQPTYDSFESGQENVVDTQSGPLRDHYRLVQEMLGHPQLPHAEQHHWEVARDTTIRLIFYDARIRVKFEEVYGAEVEQGFAELGLTAPKWSELSRAEAKAAIQSFKDSIDLAPAPSPAVQRAYELLHKGLEQLSTELVPNEWV